MPPATPRNAPETPETRRPFNLPTWMLILLAAVPLLLVPLWGTTSGEPVSYSEFKELLAARKVDSLVVRASRISGSVDVQGAATVIGSERARELAAAARGAGALRFVTVRVEDPTLVEELQAARVGYRGEVENSILPSLLGWILPLGLIFLLWRNVLRGGGPAGMMAIGKSQAKLFAQESTGVTFDDVAGIDEARADLMEIVDFLQNPDRYRRLGGRIPKGVLLVGAPGTGKTLLAKALAGEAKVAFLSLSGSDFVEMFVGVGAARVRDLFVQAQAQAPSIIFIDELDALGKARSAGATIGGHEEREQTLNQLLAEMDGFDTNRGVIIMAATNRPEVLDPALLRPGRFDRHVAIDRPDLNGRRQILEVHVRNVKLAASVDLAAVAARTPGFAGADLANLVNEATLRAAKHDKPAVEMSDFDEALDRIVAGLEKKNRVMNPMERKFVAYHEAGHALVAEMRKNTDRVSKVSIIPRGIAALGYTQQSPTEDRYLMRKSELLDRIDVLLGGRVAEKLIFDDVSTGAENDLQRATDMARHMITHYGMSESLGLATFDSRPVPLYLNGPSMPGAREFSERTAEAIDAEVRRILDEARERVTQTLTAHQPTLDAIAALLLEKEVVDRSMLDRLMSEAATAAQLRAAAVPARTE